MSEGFPALRANSYRDTWCGQVLPDRVDSEVRVAGWVHRRRDHGGLVFIDLRDRTGLVQLVINPDEAGEAFKLGHELRAEDVLSAKGSVVKRSPETVNKELPTGEVEIKVTDAELLSDADTPPFEIESFSGEVSEENRLRYRYLDLRRDRMGGGIGLAHSAPASPHRCASSCRARASWRSRRRFSPAPPRKGLATSWFQPGCSAATSTRCPSHRSSSSSS